MLDQLAGFGATDVRVDLAAVTFIGTNGLSFLARLQQQVTGAGHMLTAVNPSPAVRRGLELVTLDRVITVIGPGGRPQPADTG